MNLIIYKAPHYLTTLFSPALRLLASLSGFCLDDNEGPYKQSNRDV